MADLTTEDQREEHFNLLDEEILLVEEDAWMMYFDRASNKKGFGVDILLVSPEGAHIPISVKPNFEITNNMIEYEACIIELQATIEIGAEKL